jgi:ribonuclease E
MKKEMLINVLQPEECRIAIVEDGVLEELYVERTSHESYTGNIYKGKIVNLEPAIQAAFVDFSVGRNGFLHVSDIEPQYFERKSAAHDAPEPGARDPQPERKRDPRRDRERGRGRDDRRRGVAADAGDSPSGPPPGAPWDEDRPRDRGRPPRDRDKERGRERERPDLSIRGRRDRSEPPQRRFGEGLVEPAEPWPEPAPPPEAAPEPPPPGGLAQPGETPSGRIGPASSFWPEISERIWGMELPREGDEEFGRQPPAAFEREPDPALERQPFAEVPGETPPGVPRSVEPFEADLPPSRTQRPRMPAHPGEAEGMARGQADVAPPRAAGFEGERVPDERGWGGDLDAPRGREPRRGHGNRRGRRRAAPPTGRSAPGAPSHGGSEVPPGTGPLHEGVEPLLEDIGPIDEPPPRRGGREAIRSRGGSWERPRDVYPPPDLGLEQSGRGQAGPADFDSEQPLAPRLEQSADFERQRPPDARESIRDQKRDRERARPHGRAGEPGYVPRRERQRSGDAAFGADLFPESPAWQEEDVEPELQDVAEPPAAQRARDVDLGPEYEQGSAGVPGPSRSDPRRRRRRRGRRREREGGRSRNERSAHPGRDSLLEDYEGPEADIGSSRPLPAGPPIDEELSDLDDLDLEEIEPAARARRQEDDFAADLLTDVSTAPARDEIDLELEQEIRREIGEIEELEREMGMRGSAEAPARRTEEPRGGRAVRGRGPARPPIQEIFRRGEEVLVQVIKESIGTKGPTLSTYISIPGRYLVLMPGLNRVGVSRKIVDEGQRRKLREIMLELNPPSGLGFIVRTAGLERTKRELARDLAYLLRLWKVILRRIKKSRAPTPIYQESDMIIRTIRDIFNSEIDTIWIDEPSAFERAQDFLRVVMPRFVNRLKIYEEKVPLFHKYGIEDEIAKIQRRHVPLPEGGSIVIDQTEALVAIDVNSGNFRVEDDAERTAYEMNLRAAKEIARQLRLRDLGGVIVNDFIDMREERHRRGVERALREAIKRDRARTKVLRMSAFGLIEMTRQRIRPSLKRSIYEDCHHCGGAGVVKTAESMAIDVMRLVALATHRQEIRRIVISVHPTVASYLSNRKRKEITRCETECNMTIQIGFEEHAPAERLKIECYDANGNEVRLTPAPPAGHRRGH